MAVSDSAISSTLALRSMGKDMQRKKNDVKARTTLLLSLYDEHQLRFSKYKTAKELWAAILKMFAAVVQLEGGLTEYKEREVKYIEKIRTLEMYRATNLKSIKALDKELEEVKLEKDGLDGKLTGLLEALKNLDHLIESQRIRVQRETTRSQKYAYESPSHRSVCHISHRPSMRPSYRPAGHRPHGSAMNPRRPTMNGTRPYKSFFNQEPSYETRHFLKSSAVRTQYRAPWVPTVNRNNPPVSRKFSTGRRNFPTVTRKFPTASRKFTNGSTKNHTADMGRKGKAVKPSAC
nr:hypothetical protein [Tanacetum cinerariifolium]GEX90289.1 hypothetical protein [Tanacetum cinerariifolium]